MVLKCTYSCTAREEEDCSDADTLCDGLDTAMTPFSLSPGKPGLV